MLCTVHTPLNARPMYMWSHDELTAKADLIVIAAINSTHDEINNYDKSTLKPDSIIPVLSIFDVKSVLKGTLPAAVKSISIRHERYYDQRSATTVIDGPCFIHFNTTKKNSYMIYLHKEQNGIYTPLSGQYDPGLSFFLLNPYHTSNE